MSENLKIQDNPVNLVQLKASDIPAIRDEILQEQDFKCAICEEPITENSGAALDHQHKFKLEEIGVNGGGLVRGVLCRRCNVLEGRIYNNSRRYGIKNLTEWLRNLIIYLEKDNYNYIHPSEKPKEKTVSKSQYNKLKKAYTAEKLKKKFPEYPASGKLTKGLKELFEKFNISPFLI